MAVPAAGARRLPRGAADVERERIRRRVPGREAAHAHAARQLAILSDAPRYLLEIGFVVAIIGISAVLFGHDLAG